MQTTHAPRIAVSDLLHMKVEAAAIVALLHGEFDKEIAAVTKAHDELKKRQGTDQTYADAKKKLAEAQAKLDAAQKVEDEASKLLEQAKTNVKGIEDKIAADGAEIKSQRAAIESATAKLAADRSAFDAACEATKQVLARQSAALDVRESSVAAGEKRLSEAQTKLNADRSAFNKRLEALKA